MALLKRVYDINPNYLEVNPPAGPSQGCFILDRHGDAPDTPDTGMEAFKRR
ncbi:MAG: hypothetical protein F6K48_11090 [Okeania sp. SIO3H1]|nr:hypothetical protein [Okeania sp. SIO3H1]